MPTKIHRSENPFRVVKQLLAGKSLTRSLFNLAIERYEMRGEILDLGSKNGTSSYYKHIQRDGDCRITFTDLIPGPDVVQVDVEKPFPFPDASFDTVMAFHLMEHVYNLNKLPSEVFRVLKPGGQLFISVPLLHEYHGDPHDYWRFTDKAVIKLFSETKLTLKRMELIGEGLATYAATKVISQMLPRTLGLKNVGVAISYLLSAPLDRFINRYSKRTDNRTYSERFALDVLAEFKK